MPVFEVILTYAILVSAALLYLYTKYSKIDEHYLLMISAIKKYHAKEIAAWDQGRDEMYDGFVADELAPMQDKYKALLESLDATQAQNETLKATIADLRERRTADRALIQELERTIANNDLLKG
jgi:hypothetical protein